MSPRSKRYVVAGVITIILFVLGFLFSYITDQARLDDLRQKGDMQNLDFLSLQLRFSFLNTLEQDGGGCLAFRSSMDQSVGEFQKSNAELEEYKKSSFIVYDPVAYERLLKKYALDNIKFWILAKEAKKKCNLTYLPVLYFYSGHDCPDCDIESRILEQLRKELGSYLLMFPVNIDNKNIEPTIEVVRSRYDIQDYPTLVIENDKYQGFVNATALKYTICYRLQNLSIESCMGVQE